MFSGAKLVQGERRNKEKNLFFALVLPSRCLSCVES